MISFLKKHLTIFVVILALILTPQSLNIQSELKMRIIITSIGIDYTDDKYAVTAQVVRPQNGSEGGGRTAQLDFLTTEADSIVDALYQISFLLGKTAGLGHINSLVFGQSLVENEKVLPAIDYFVRDARIPSSTLLLVSEAEAKDELKNTSSLELSTAINMQKLFLYKEMSMNGVMMQLEQFLNFHNRIGKSVLISGIKFEDESSKESGGKSGESGGQSSGGSSSGGSEGGNSESQSGGESSGGGEGGGSSSGGGNSSNVSKRIKYDNSVYLFKDGKLAYKFDSDEELDGINYLNSKSEYGIIHVDGVNDDVYTNASVDLYVRDKKIKYTCKFDENGRPKCKLKLSTSRNEISEIVDEKGSLVEMYYTEKDFITDALKDKVKDKIISSSMEVYNKAKENGCDILHLGEKLYARHPKQWKEFYEKYGEDYLNYIDFEIEVAIIKTI
ncbi:MAG: hypothetical protein J6J23_01040 [Clostridia bacterium]|nr:hypothetical protein [Clostridia bacterium]